MRAFGFVRSAVACPVVHVGHPAANVREMLPLLEQAEQVGTDVIVFPELGLTGYTCGDLFHQDQLLASAQASLQELITRAGEIFSGVLVVGLPWRITGKVYNCAAVCQAGQLLGVVPKLALPNYKEFYEARYFASGHDAVCSRIDWQQEPIPFGADLVFRARTWPDFVLGIEICEDLWTPIPPSSRLALSGATVIANLSASNEIIGKSEYRKQLVASQSGRCIAGYLYSSSGPHESSTDLVFGGHCLIAENGVLLAESPRFQRAGHLTIADLDLDHLVHDRTTSTTFVPGGEPVREVPCELPDRPRSPELLRPVEAHPFVPTDPARLKTRCEEIFATQVSALAQRLDHIGRPSVCLGISGGLDSTLALLVVCKTFDLLGEPRGKMTTLTLPGFGTTERTRKNALILMRELGTCDRTVDIRPLCLEQLRALEHRPFGINLTGHTVESLTQALQALPEERRQDLVFENVQARVRTSLLMNTGFVIGTGDVSELALGWCTYNADHMSMYNPNVSIPKTLVKFLVGWAAEHEFTGNVQATLRDIVATEISPELLPLNADGHATQSTEAAIGPYELQDFFLYHFLRWGSTPRKIHFLAQQARFHARYTSAELKHWLTIFLKRFFANQFKRSCLPDGPKVGSVSVSPRGDWRMPSDADRQAWLESLDEESTLS